MKDKQFILSEIRRTAALNDGKPIGQTRFRTETGIAQDEWRGVHWARWGDALSEAGFEPLEWTPRSDEEQMIEGLLELVRKYGRYPVKAEIRIEKRNNPQIPAPNVLLRRFGEKAKVIQKVRDYCSSREEYADVFAILAQEDIGADSEDGVAESKTEAKKLKPSGHVYLVKSGRLYKIGQTANRWQRMNQLDKQTSEGIDEVIHTIAAFDDAPGIERYWHQRFETKRVKGEWFDLSADDIRAFKKRKWM
jgi:hypothetical protein